MKGSAIPASTFGAIAVALVLGLCHSALAAGEGHALLIGIQDYGPGPIPSLKGPRQDIKLVEETLRDRYAVSNIQTLLDAEATHSGVRDAFARLTGDVKPGDFVYIHYSGHGSHTTDLNGDEARGDQDQTWVTHGARSGAQSGIDDFGILDDEINAWLKPILAKTEDLVVVSDSCHSASVTRGKVTGVRSLDGDDREHPLARQAVDRADQKEGVRIGAARDQETAIEIQAEDGKTYGLFTWYWVQELNKAAPGETWDDVFKRAYTLVSTHRGAHQRPQLEGSGGRSIFGGDFPDRSARVAVLKVDRNSGRATIDTGVAKGATAGSVYQGFDPREPDPDGLPSLELQTVSTFTSRAKITQGSFEPGDLVVEVRHAYRFEPIRLAVEGDFPRGKDRALLARLEASLQGLSGFTMVTDRANADWIAYVLRPRRANGSLVYDRPNDSLPRSFTDQPPEVWVVSASNDEALLHELMRIPLDDPEKGMKVLRENLAKYARIQELKRLGSGVGALDVELLFFLLRAELDCDDSCVELMAPDGSSQFYRREGPMPLEDIQAKGPGLGDVLGFAVHNRDKRRHFYAYLINIAPGGDVLPIFPRPEDNREYARVDAGELRDLSSDVGLMFNEAGETAPVEEYVKLIVANQPIDVQVFQRDGYQDVIRRSGTAVDPLERLIGEALYTRGQVAVPADREWATREAVFEIAPRL